MQNIKRVVFLFLFLLSVLTDSTGFAQNSGSEFAFLHTDRTSYVAGELVYFKFIVLDVNSNKPSDRSKVGYISLRSMGKNKVVNITCQLEKGMTHGAFVLPDTLASGVYELIAFTNIMKNEPDKYPFRKEMVLVNRFDKNLTIKSIQPFQDKTDTKNNTDSIIQTNKQIYGMREKVSVRIQPFNVPVHFSVTVHEQAPVSIPTKSITETYRRLQVPKTTTKTEFQSENKTKILTGKVLDANDGKYVRNATVLLSCPDSIPNLQYAFTNSEGTFHFALSEYYTDKELFLTIRDLPANSHWKIVLEDQFNIPMKESTTNYISNPSLKDFFIKSQNIYHINKTYNKENDSVVQEINKFNIFRPQVYNCPVITIIPADFLSLNDFSEIAIELIPQIRMTKQENKYSLQVLGASMYTTEKNEPAIFLDGVYVDDITKITGLGSDKIKKIELLDIERAYGDLHFQGIISITSRSNEIAHTLPAAHSVRFKNNIIKTDKAYKICNPNELKKRRTPDVRQLLYWKPDLTIKPNETGEFEFYTTDNTGDFVIEIEGISEDGKPISATTGFQVKNEFKTLMK